MTVLDLTPSFVETGRILTERVGLSDRVDFDLGDGTKEREALSCKLMVQEGMRVTDVALEIRYCLRELEIPR